MKKAMKKIAIISAVVTAALFAMNMLIGLLGGDIIGIHFGAGGEMIQYAGFGVMQKHIVPLSTPDSPGGGSSFVVPEPFTLIGTFLICLAAGCIVYFLRRFVCSMKAKAAARKNEA